MTSTSVFATILQILAALFMAFIWAAYLRKLDIFRPEKWWKIGVAFAVGCLTPLPILFIISDYFPEFYRQPGTTIEIFQFFTLNVGMVEEGFKFLGFLLIFLVCRKWFDEDINYLVYASAVGLGFATNENCLYFFHYGIDLVYIRGLMCAVGHMCGTALIGSLLCIGIKKKGFNIILYPLSGFLIASVLHGLYDGFLSVGWDIIGPLFSILVFMVEFEIWAQYANNLLNQSRYYKNNIAVDRTTLQKFLIAAFIVAGMIQLVGLTMKEDENPILSHLFMLVIELLLTIIVVARITRHTVIPGHWAKVYPRLPFSSKSNPSFGGVSIGTYASSNPVNINIRGDQFNEYPFTSRINKLIKLVPLQLGKFRNNGETLQCWIIDKVFLGKRKELFYLCELAGQQLHVANAHPTHFLIKPKLGGNLYYEKWPIIGIITIDYHADLKNIQPAQLVFQHWAIFKDEEKEHFTQTWKEMIF